MLDFFLYRLVIKDYLPSIYNLFPEHYQESLFVVPGEENIKIDSYTLIDKINPIKRIADSKHSRLIELLILIIITIISIYVSYKCKGPAESMYIIFSTLFPITHFIILSFPRILPKSLGKYIGCNYEQIRKKQRNLEEIKLATQNIGGRYNGGKYKRK